MDNLLNYRTKSMDLYNSEQTKDIDIRDDDSKNGSSRSSDHFDVGNIFYRDYNNETMKNSNFSVDVPKRYKNNETFGDSKHINEHRDFYEISIDDMPNRTNLLKGLYEDIEEEEDDDDYYFSSKRATEKTGVKNADGKKSVGKIFKRRV